MPFTPLHLGIGAGFKAVQHRPFSFLIFAGTQVLMDIEPLLGLIYSWETLHLYTHNLVGAFIIGGLAVLFGRPITQWVLRILAYSHWQISWKTAWMSAMIGSFSHVLLDAFMHHDMYPFFPITLHNPLLHLVPYPLIFSLCILGIILGGSIAWFRTLKQRPVTHLDTDADLNDG